MAIEISEDKKEALKTILNSSVKLLELLNVLLPKIQSYESFIPADLLEEVAQQCFELGASIATNGEEISKSSNDDDSEYEAMREYWHGF